jgi:predicted secreted protein
MPTPIAQAAINTFLQLSDGSSPESFSTVANVASITGMTFSAQVVDVTSHSTGTPWREKIVTLLDAGTISCDVYFVPNDSGHQRLLSVFVNRGLPTAPQSPADWRISFPTVPSRTVYSFSAYISKFSMSEPVDGVIKASMELQVIGEPGIPNVNA